MADFDPSDRTQPLHAPAAPLSGDEIAEMVRKLRLARSEVHTLPNSAARLYGDAADALEALTAENARLTAYSRHQYSLGHEAAAVEIGGEIDALKDELDWVCEMIVCWCDRDRVTDKERLGVLRHMPPVTDWLKREKGKRQRDFYEAYRLRVEAAHAAAKEDASDDDPLAILRSAYPAPRLDDGIDMALLSDLCREEPDEATKREVSEMMAKVRATEYSPLSHPDYPALMAEAMRQAKDGD